MKILIDYEPVPHLGSNLRRCRYRSRSLDQATVPLYYENRIPELQLENDDLTEDVYTILDTANLDDDQEDKLEREFSRQYHLITRSDRLDKIVKRKLACLVAANIIPNWVHSNSPLWTLACRLR